MECATLERFTGQSQHQKAPLSEQGAIFIAGYGSAGASRAARMFEDFGQYDAGAHRDGAALPNPVFYLKK